MSSLPLNYQSQIFNLVLGFEFKVWNLRFGHWSLFGYWLLVIGYWCLVIGHLNLIWKKDKSP
jgi:hypothetical protein